jgi:hypothetical protein
MAVPFRKSGLGLEDITEIDAGDIYYKHMSRTENFKIGTELNAFVNVVFNFRVPYSKRN